jgi:hypothetical protein
MFHHRSAASATPQDSLQFGVNSVMDADEDEPSLAVYESVSCLECGTVYAKPSLGGTRKSNPGCPECCYVGWVSVSSRPEEAPPRRSGEGRPQARSAQSR